MSVTFYPILSDYLLVYLTDFAPSNTSQCELAKVTSTQEIISTKPQIIVTSSQYSSTTEQPHSFPTNNSSVTNSSSVKQETKNDCVIVGGVLGGVIGLLVVILCAIVGWVLTWYYTRSKQNR